MKKLGIAALVVGILGLVVALSMDTSVSTDNGLYRVNNLGLMSEKQNYVLTFLVIALGGVLTLIAQKMRRGGSPIEDSAGDRRACPACAELIKAKAVVCRYCRTNVDPLPITADANKSSTYVDDAKEVLGAQASRAYQWVEDQAPGADAAKEIRSIGMAFLKKAAQIVLIAAILLIGLNIFLNVSSP